tara:strand:+ start:64 stop:492 length:429 start_codon:yes stop_codon:yes gene_type:complete
MDSISHNFDVMNLIGGAVEKERYLARAEANARDNQLALKSQFDDLCEQVEFHHTNADVCGQREADLWKAWMEDGGWCELMCEEMWSGVQEDEEEQGPFALMGVGERSREIEKERRRAFNEFLAKNEIPYDADRGEWTDGDDV